MDLYKITLSERDNYLDQIEAQISSKRTLLLEKRKNLEESIKQNQFLEGIKNDYQLYSETKTRPNTSNGYFESIYW